MIMKKEKTCYFEILEHLYAYTFTNRCAKEDLRKNLSIEYKQILEDSLSKLFESKKGMPFEQTVQNLLQAAGNIFLLQPFIDGNTRTAAALISFFLYEKQYLTHLINSIEWEGYIPIFYQVNEEVTPYFVENFKEKVKCIQKDGETPFKKMTP